MARNQAACHPNKPNHGHGLCRSCYNIKWYAKNKDKSKRASDLWRTNNRQRAKKTLRKSRLKTWYGLTEEDYSNLLAKQDGVCAICKNESLMSLSVDHNHTTGKVRGLLCGMCNTGLGYFRDNAESLKNAALYLKGIQ